MGSENERKTDTVEDQADRPRLGRAMAALMGEAPPPARSVSAPLPSEPEPEPEPQGQPGEHGGPKGPEPTRFGDWERKGRCIDF